MIRQEQLRKSDAIHISEEHIYISENWFVRAYYCCGTLMRVIGKRVKAEIVELNHVKVVSNGKTQFFKLGTYIHWKEDEDLVGRLEK